MNVLIIDTPNDVTGKAAVLHKADAVGTVFGYLSSIWPAGPKCWSVARVKAAAAAGLRIGLVHEGWGGVPGHGGISAPDGARDGAYARKRAAELGAPKGACVYFACDNDFLPAQIAALVIPYFKAIRAAFAGSGYRVGVYGSGAVCQAVIAAGLADLSWEAQSRGWLDYAAFAQHASLTQGPCTHLEGLDVDTDVAHGDIGDFMPSFSEPAPVPPANPPAPAQIKEQAAPPAPAPIKQPATNDPLVELFAHIFGQR